MTIQGEFNQHATITVSPARLNWGTWSHEQNCQINEGDISAAYSADVIALKGRVRRPFQHAGKLYVTIASQNHQTAEAYQLQLPQQFDGPTATYQERCQSENCRSIPEGFYHGIRVKNGQTDYVLVGPKQTFHASNEPVLQQGTLF